MSTSRLYLTTALVLSLSAGFAPAAFAQDTQQAAPAADEQPTEIVVTGQRASRRSRLDTLAPVDVVTAQSLQTQGSTELAQGLSRVAPSLNFPRPAGVDGTDNVRPASLRGLSPDQTLVLVDGKRRHTSALVNVNGSTGRGSSAVDLNAIPEIALDRLEVLRDGASAQYGSDAIAGVINLHLREANHGAGVSVSYGEYDTDVSPANSSRHASDGATTNVSGWVGLPLGSDGFLTISAETRHRAPTSRGDIDGLVSPAVVTSRYGDPAQLSASVFVNAGKPLNDNWTLYGNASASDLNSKSAAFFRHTNASGNIPEIYPFGFLPIINAQSKDYSATIGLRGALGEWTSDFSLSAGGNKLDYYTLNSVNPSYGAASPRDFYDGQLKYDQTVFNADISRPFAVSGWASPLTLALGLEARQEKYAIKAGDVASYALGSDTTRSAGAQGFSGFQPSNVVDVDRNNVGVYADVAADITDRFSFDAAIRAENYSDFGDNVSGKLAARYKLTDNLALRGSVSTGFRAPSLAQQYFTSTASVLDTSGSVGKIVETGTFPATSPVAEALGAEPLNPEKSTSYTLGGVWHSGPFEVTLDAYSIKIDDRILLSENISSSFSPQVAALLAPYGVSAARFFINGADTTTNGVDLVANYRLPTDFGRFNFSLAYNHNETEIDRLNPLNNSPLNPQPVLFARVRQVILTNSSPEDKATVGVDWNAGNWTVNGRATYYGDVIDPASVQANDIHSGDHTLVDLSASYRFGTGTTVTLGADNLFDEYPNATPANLNITSGNGVGALSFTRFSPFGFNGRYLYAKLSQTW
ncbi:TonB-dependent receptor plug domain-containing protein [Asticcacaulis sp.]|uniref:TonB-dependent receptor plug domain-containing protein n=1 Tax=Asticcacaulis sp. TaxID=1872648 RepID=UPI003F7BEB1D